MSFRQIRSIACLVAAAALGWAAFERRTAPLACALLALLCATLIVIAWRARHGKQSTLHDPAISTLVFPPESKFQPSVLPKR